LDAVRQTFDVASLVHPWTDNTGLPGFVLHNTNNQSLAQWTSRIALVASVLFLWQMRKLPTTALFALSVLLMCVSQGISWNMYYGVTMVALLSLRDLHPSRTYWAAAAIGYVITTGILLHATYFLFGLSRGMPITIGLLTTTAIYAAVALQSPANRNLAHP
jgi:hypothetical protein